MHPPILATFPLRRLVILGVLWLLALSPAAATAAQPAAPQQQGEPVYALIGRLLEAENRPFGTFLITPDGDRIALLGQTPAVEQEIVRLRELEPSIQVKVWGTLYPDGRLTRQAEIVASAIQPAQAVPTPTPSVPTVTTNYRSVNIRRGPGLGYQPVGGLLRGQSCTIIGRSEEGQWWQIRCADGTTGWVSDAVVEVRGNVRNIPIVPVYVAPEPVEEFPDWQASYYNNPSLEGTPVLVRNVEEIDFYWGQGAPAPNLAADQFSIRFVRTINFPTGNYRFTVTVDDGVRVWLDNQLLIDSWEVRSARTLTAERVLSGAHEIRIDYFEAFGVALLEFDYELLRAAADWRAAYFNNPNLSGAATYVRNEPRSRFPLERNWETGSPVPGVITEDNWSARWIGDFYFESGDYLFTATADDGVRVYIDDILVLNGWEDGYKDISNRFLGIGAGEHEIRVEYYERFGRALLTVRWSRTGASEE